MSRYILALDQGTTSSRAILFDRSGNIIQMAQQEFTQHYPQPGWVEHNPNELFDSQAVVAAKCLRQAGITGSEVAAVGIANQRETTVVWNRRSAVNCCSAQWIRGSSGISPRARSTRPIPPTPAVP